MISPRIHDLESRHHRARRIALLRSCLTGLHLAGHGSCLRAAETDSSSNHVTHGPKLGLGPGSPGPGKTSPPPIMTLRIITLVFLGCLGASLAAGAAATAGARPNLILILADDLG